MVKSIKRALAMWTSRHGSARMLAGLLALSLSGQSLAIDRSQHGQYASCKEGDCDNGQGTIVRIDRQKAYTGRWSNGRFVAGLYEIKYAGVSGTFPMKMSADGIPLEGTRPFASGTDKYATYTGTFGPPPDTFVTEGNPLLSMFRKPDSVLKRGRYVDTEKGYIYEGEFHYIPVVEKIEGTQFGDVTLARGVYVLLGSRIDETLDEVETGVFASVSTVGPDTPFYLSPASPGYMLKLQETLAATRANLQAEKAASARASKEAWNTFLGVMTGVAVAAIASKVASSDKSVSVGTLQSVLEGREDPAAIAQRFKSAQTAPSARSSAPNTMSVADYKRLREGGANVAASSSAVPSAPVAQAATPAAAASANNNVSASQVAAKKSYPGLPRIVNSVWDSSSNISGKKQSTAWCQKEPQEIRNNFKNSPNDLISVGQCSCELDKASPANQMKAFFEAQYFCKFKYVWRQNVPDSSER